MAESVHELECPPHLIGRHQVLVIQVRLAEEEAHNRDLSPVQVVGDAEHVVLFLGWGLGLGLHVADDVLPLAGAVVVVDATLPEHLERRPRSDVVL